MASVLLLPDCANIATKEGDDSKLSHNQIIHSLIGPTSSPKPGPARRNPGRMDGVKWNGSSFICNGSVDGGMTTYDVVDDWDVDFDFESDYDLDVGTTKARCDRMTVLMSDIARLAKPRGRSTTKNFRVCE